MPRRPPSQIQPGPARHPEKMWLHWTLHLLSWIIESIQLHPVALQPVPPQAEFPTEGDYHTTAIENSASFYLSLQRYVVVSYLPYTGFRQFPMIN